ncbi:MAG: RidA family protein [Beutenbergiaceae bacterium]
MPTAAQRMAQAGIVLPDVVAPVAAYVPAVRVGSLVMTSGQLPMRDGVLAATGIVGDGPGYLSAEDAVPLARLCALNAVAAAADAAGGLDRLARVVKVVGFVAAEPSFAGHPSVINGASDLFHQIFGDAGVHARSAVGVASLPLGAPVEVEAIFELA